MADAGGPNLPWGQFKEIVDNVQECGRNLVNPPPPLPPTYTVHAQKLNNALAEAKKHTAAGWAACVAELEHGH